MCGKSCYEKYIKMKDPMTGKFVRILTRIAKMVCQRFGNYRYKKIFLSHNLKGDYKRIYFYHIRKTAGTSLNHMFLSCGGEKGGDVYARITNAFTQRIVSNNLVFVGWDQKLIEQGNYFYAFSHLPFHKIKLPEQTFTFTCLRDPVSRVLSHYKMLIECQQSISPPSWYEKEKDWLGNNIKDFLNRAPKEHLLSQLFMFSEKFDIEEAFDGIMSCSSFMFTENFDQGVNLLSSRTGCELKPLHIRKALIDINAYDTAIERLRLLLEPEYILYEKLRKYACNSQIEP